MLATLACSFAISGRLVEAQEPPLSQLVVNLFQPERFLTPSASVRTTPRISS
jgi:hypothetical protein